ncbi:hypothetical protein VHEMI03438 [[Torrubiella] hemipterigena]|uniref:Uncharacterized protein n=1 Tax=[Torrubiella] hemipterigena TaxID=1531966 RepID=A0A0A1TDD9_9HYPO|nr:hypothetical protein VHEMI03438 [[Torrubiella] hemipterigena]
MDAVQDACQIKGADDLYGIGVRAGLYTQWVATLIATLFDPETESDIRLANIIIQCSIFLGLCTESRNDGASAVGAIVTQVLLCGSLSSLTGDGFNHAGKVSGIMRFLFYTGLSAYGCWFWFYGIDSMMRPGCNEVAFFGLTSFHGWFRTLGKVLSIIGVVLCSILDIYSLYALGVRFSQGMEAFAPPPKQRPQVELSLLVISTGLLVFSIVLIEYILDHNRIELDNSPISVGQLIPLIAGGLAALLVLWKVIMNGLMWKGRCWFLFGKHL